MASNVEDEPEKLVGKHVPIENIPVRTEIQSEKSPQNPNPQLVVSGPDALDQDTSLPPQRVQALSSQKRSDRDLSKNALASEQELYQQALRAQEKKSFAEAAELWKSFIEGTQDKALAIDARIFLAEALLETTSLDEAVALTFDVLPEGKMERQMGITRSDVNTPLSSRGGQPSLKQKIMLYTLRGRILAALNQFAAAGQALNHAGDLLEKSGKTLLSQEDRMRLTANWAWRELEAKQFACKNVNPVPARLSEAEFLAYARGHYSCAAPARLLVCKILAAEDKQIRNHAVVTYQRLVEAPLELRKHLPPPARDILKKDQRSHYEREMIALIEKTVKERSVEFKNIDECRAYDLF